MAEVAASAEEPSTQVHALPAPPSGAVDDVVLITLDTLRADTLGFMGDQRVSTPALDRLAATGWVFDDARAHNVVTLPSHANILSGLHPFEHGVRDNTGFVFPSSIPTAATLLSAAGLATGAFVGAFPLDSRFGLAGGFDLYDDDYHSGSSSHEMDLPERPGSEVVRRTLDWWEATSGRRFAWVHLYDPHAPYLAPEPFGSRHRDTPYLGEVEATDSYLRPLLERLTGDQERSVLIVVTSDHGEALGDHGELTHGLFAYEATLRVPLIVWVSGTEPGRSAKPARHVDLLPTILTAAGVEVPAGLAGVTLFSGSEARPSEPQYFEALTSTFNSGFAPLRGLVADGYKFISLPLPELYDLRNDPQESNNLIEADRDRVRSLVRLLPVESAWPPARGEISEEAESALRSLGYLTGEAAAREEYGPEDDPKRVVVLDRKVHSAVDLLRRGDPVGAERLVREVIAARPQMTMAWSFLSQALLESGRRREAIEVMSEAERKGLARDAVRRQLALTLAEVGRFREALAVLDGFGDSNDPELLNVRGLVLSEAGRQTDARTALERLLADRPTHLGALVNLALVELRSQRWEEARQRAQAALELSEERGEAWNYLGTALYNLGDPPGAVRAWERAAEVDGEAWDALFNLALVAGQIGDTGRARRALERFVEGAPQESYAADLERARALLRQLPRG